MQDSKLYYFIEKEQQNFISSSYIRKYIKGELYSKNILLTHI